jgi:SanA protein
MKYLKIIFLLCAIFILGIISINLLIVFKSKEFIFNKVDEVPKCYTAIVLGALVSKSGDLSDILQDRLDMAIELYKKDKIKRFLLSGDHGRKNYDEVNSMKNYLIQKGIKTEDIFLDHAGFDTYNTMTRAREIFEVTDVVIVSQEFHLSRAIYIARKKGLTAYGIVADRRNYISIARLQFREYLANVKAFFEVLINKQPKFLGNKIPINGDSSLSYD